MNPKGIGRLTERVLTALGKMASSLEADSPPVEHTVIGAIIEVEAYTDHVLRRLIECSGVTDIPLGRLLVSQNQDSFYQNWKNRYFWLRNAFDVSVTGTSAEQDFATLVELRNAIIHGGGRLTEKQTRDIKQQIALERRLDQVLKVQIEGQELINLDGTDSRAIKVARTFVLLLDGETRRVHPDLII